MILGTISAVDNDNGLQLIIDGEDAPTTKKYTYVASYVPTANDRVLIEEISGSYVIMGKVINDYTASGIVRQADNADSASTASVSDTTKGFDSSVKTAYGQVVSNFTKVYNAQLGMYIVTDITLSPSSKQYFVYK